MELEQLKNLVIDKLEDMKAQDIKAVDVRGRSPITEMMIIATGNSTRHVKSLAQSVELAAKEAGVKPAAAKANKPAAEAPAKAAAKPVAKKAAAKPATRAAAKPAATLWLHSSTG